MWPSNLKLYIYAALFVGAIAFFMRYDYVTEQNKVLKADVEQYQKNEEASRKAIEAANKAITEYLTNIETKENEIKNLSDRVSSGSTVLRVKATCPKLPTASTDTTRIETASPELTEDARQDYYSLRRAIVTTEERYRLCVKTLEDERK